MRVGKALKIVVNKSHQKQDDCHDVLQINYILDGEAKDKTHIITDVKSLTDEEKVVFTKMFMIIERLLKSSESNNLIGI